VPTVQYLLLRKELPYRRYLGYTGVYMLIGAAMLLCVRGAGKIIPWGGWAGLGVQVLVGISVYGILTLLYWKLSGFRPGSGLLRKISGGHGKKA